MRKGMGKTNSRGATCGAVHTGERKEGREREHAGEWENGGKTGRSHLAGSGHGKNAVEASEGYVQRQRGGQRLQVDRRGADRLFWSHMPGRRTFEAGIWQTDFEGAHSTVLEGMHAGLGERQRCSEHGQFRSHGSVSGVTAAPAAAGCSNRQVWVARVRR